jgi:hypothetical protein
MYSQLPPPCSPRHTGTLMSCPLAALLPEGMKKGEERKRAHVQWGMLC